MYSFNPGNQFALGHKKYQVLETVTSCTIKVTDTETGHSHTMSTEELYDAYDSGKLFFFSGSEKLEEKTLKKLLNPANELLNVEKETVYVDDYLKRDPFTFSEEEIEIVEFKLSFIDEIIKARPKALTGKHLEPIVKNVFEREHLASKKKIPSHHTVRKWYEKYYRSGNQSSSLLPQTKHKGNRNDRYKEHKEIIDQIIAEIYLTRNQNSIYTAYDKIDKAIRRIAPKSKPPNYTSIYKRIKKMERDFPYEVMCAREGKVAANEKYRGANATYQESRALECVEIDSTRLNLFVVYWNGKPAGRPWLTIVRDRYTQCITGFYIGFEPPSLLSVSKALKHSFLRKDNILTKYPKIKNTYPCFGLPEIIICDNGKEYWSKAFKLACRDLDIVVNYSPVRTPRIKGGVESFFKTLNIELLHQQSGTSFSDIFKRKDYDPEKNAIIHFDKLVEILYTWIIDVYHQKAHKGELDLKTVIPSKRWIDTASIFPPMLPSKDSFDILFGQVFKRTITKKGIEIDYIFYHSTELQNLRQRRGNIETTIKLDPEDMRKIYVYDEVSEKYVIAYSLLPDYTKGLSRWQHKNNIRIAKILAGKVDKNALADADARIQKLVQECLHSDTPVAAKSKVSRHLAMDNENPHGKPSTSNKDKSTEPVETLPRIATGHDTVTPSDIPLSSKARGNKKTVTPGFPISKRLQEKINESNKKP